MHSTKDRILEQTKNQETEKVVKDLALNKVPDNFMHEFIQNFRKKIIYELFKLS